MRVPDYPDKRLLFGMLFIISNKLQAMGDTFYEEITMKQWMVFAMIQIFGEENPTLNEIAEVVGSSHQNVKQIVLKLNQRGYVEMYSDPVDKRKTRVLITEKGEELKEKYDDKQQTFMKNLYQNVDLEELKIAVKVIMTMEQNLESM